MTALALLDEAASEPVESFTGIVTSKGATLRLKLKHGRMDAIEGIEPGRAYLAEEPVVLVPEGYEPIYLLYGASCPAERTSPCPS